MQVGELFLNLAHQLEREERNPVPPDPIESSGPALDGTVAQERRQKRTFLTPNQDTQLAAAYQDGTSIHQLARDFDVDRLTVRAHLEHMGVPRQPYRKVQGEQLQEAIRLYESGMSLRALAKHLGVSPDMLRSRLVEAGILIRGRGRPTQT